MFDEKTNRGCITTSNGDKFFFNIKCKDNIYRFGKFNMNQIVIIKIIEERINYVNL